MDGLNEAQREAVLHKDGPLLVLAGAGAGKTKAISHKVAYLANQDIGLERILAITFTNKAANEMRERILTLLKKIQLPTSNFQFPFISTFHSLGVYILKNSGRPVSVTRNFSIFDKEDALASVKEAIKELQIDPRQFQPAKISSIISRFKGDLVTNDDFREIAGRDFFPKKLSLIWDKYEEILNKQKALDFDDLILKTVSLLQKNKEPREYYQNFWQYILIDEYQDTNKSQYELSKILAEKHKNICVIGDVDQAIYGWRGADFRNIINFEKDFPEYKTIVFEENYRSTQNILEAAARVIEKNKMRKEKKLKATKEKGAEISLFEAMNEEEEAEFVVHKTKECLRAGKNPQEIVVLFRANFQSRILEEKFLAHNIPYQMLGLKFYQRKEIKDVMAYLKASLNPDDLISVKRIINVPPRGVGKTTLLNYFAKKIFLPEFEKILSLIKESAQKDKASDVIRFILKITGYQKYLEGGGEEDKERLENIKELVSIASRYDDYDAAEGIEKFLEDALLMSEQDELDKKTEAVKLMTVHSAKGLEFDNVFVVGMEQGLFPHSGMGDDTEEKAEEERRLFYVALTRAKEKVFLSFSMTRTIFGSKQLNLPSKFLSDIPEHLIILEDYGRKEKIIEV